MRIRSLLAGLALAGAAVAQSAGPAGSIGIVDSPDATLHGAVALGANGASVMSGSQITAGRSAARVRLTRGGELHLCPAADATITSASNGREMLIALNRGAMEAHYTLASSADNVITPDFRLLLAGPGEFHFAISSQAHGEMCVQSLAGNASSIIVNEQFGDGAHQVKPGEQVTFHNGHVDDATAPTQPCGCPQPAAAAAVISNDTKAEPLSFPEQQSRKAEQAAAAGVTPQPAMAAPRARSSAPGEVHTEIDAPIVFRAEDLPPAQPSVARAKLPAWPADVAFAAAEPANRPAAKKKWYQRFGNALASFFGGGDKAK